MNLTLSVYNHLKDTLSTERQIGSNSVSGTFIMGYLDDDRLQRVRFVDDFLNGVANVRDHIAPPIITFEAGSTTQEGFELGSSDRIKAQNYIISVYAEDDVQAAQIAEMVVSGADKTIDYKDYLANYSNPTDLGLLKTDEDSIQAFHVRHLNRSTQGVPVEKILKHHMEVTFSIQTK
jgi:hypothetical protein